MRGERLPISQLVVLMAGLMIFFSVAVDEPNSPASEPEQSFEYGYPWIKGLKYEVSGPNGIVTRVKADSLSLVARRIFLFNIKSLNEIQLENAEIEAHFFEEPSDLHSLLLKFLVRRRWLRRRHFSISSVERRRALIEVVTERLPSLDPAETSEGP